MLQGLPDGVKSWDEKVVIYTRLCMYITNRDMSMEEDPRKYILNFAKDNPSVKALKVSILYNWSGSHWPNTCKLLKVSKCLVISTFSVHHR